jgi:hypothetical protein
MAELHGMDSPMWRHDGNSISSSLRSIGIREILGFEKYWDSNESSRVFETYWNYLPSLDQHLDFSNESDYTQRHMLLFSHGLSSMFHEDGQWGPQPAAEASQSDLETAEDAALSRLRPIQDGSDQWEEHRSSAATVSGGHAPR